MERLGNAVLKTGDNGGCKPEASSRSAEARPEERRTEQGKSERETEREFFFFKQKTAYEIIAAASFYRYRYRYILVAHELRGGRNTSTWKMESGVDEATHA